MTLISICVPAYHMNGRGDEMLCELLASIRRQNFDYDEYEIVVSDERFKAARHGYEVVLPPPLLYKFGARFVEGKAGAPANLNNAIDHARGDIIKPMFQDDMFMEPDALQKINDALPLMYPYAPAWCALTSHNAGEPQYREYDHVPYPHNSIEALRSGENTYGSPSAMAWRKNDMRFDENLPWLFDCEFYGRMAERYGVPAFIDSKVYIRQWSGMATHTVANGYQRILDGNYVVEKYRDHDGQPFTPVR